MVCTEAVTAPPPGLPGPIVGHWYLRGFADAYAAHWAVTPEGTAGEHYRRGYALGIAAVRQEFLTAMNACEGQPASAAEVRG